MAPTTPTQQQDTFRQNVRELIFARENEGKGIYEIEEAIMNLTKARIRVINKNLVHGSIGIVSEEAIDTMLNFL